MHSNIKFVKSSSYLYLAILQIDTLLKVCIAADHWSLNLTSILQSDIIHDHWVHNLYQPINMRLPPNPSRESRRVCFHHLNTRAYATMATNNRALDAAFITHFRTFTKHTMWPNLQISQTNSCPIQNYLEITKNKDIDVWVQPPIGPNFVLASLWNTFTPDRTETAVHFISVSIKKQGAVTFNIHFERFIFTGK